ncbi:MULTISPECIES: ABC-three component system middle component 1 [unclassified Pseudomonas]|uniref:ABC-three component system middle component 1 n=1 Tax=unclassified Pseudomonas TaxID=196821 RepID=UPI0011AF7768|nr:MULTISPECIES: ABC-three component system middle component 1 [unclassified Pseudomonas]
MQLSNGEIDLSYLTNEFQDVSFRSFTSEEKSLITCFACWFDSQENLVQYWEPIQNLLSSHFNSQSPSSKWNVYLALFSPTALSKQHKYSIQNDKFFARKIVFDDKPVDPNSEDAIQLLRNDLLGLDLNLVNKSESTKDEYKSQLSNYITTNLPENKSLRSSFIKSLIDNMESI